MSALPKWQQSERVGGHPAVDFVNTVHHWEADPPPDYFEDFDDFLAWCQDVVLLKATEVKYFRSLAVSEQRKAFRRLQALRRALHDIYATLAAGEAAPRPALDDLDDMLKHSITWRQLEAYRSGIQSGWSFSKAPATAALGPVAWQAVELLEHGSIDRLKKCPGEHCGWIFIDASKNRSRSWCSMKTCGNTAKVKRFRSKE